MSQTHERPGRESTPSSPPSTPRWVKVFGIIVIVLVLLVVVALVTGLGGDHGPSRHMPSGGVRDTWSSSVTEGQLLLGDPAGHTPSSGVTEHGVHQL